MTCIRLLLAVATMLALGCSSMAPAQWTGTKIGRNATSKDGALAVQVIADCLVAEHLGVARRWLQTLPGTLEERSTVAGLTEDLGSCMAEYQAVVLANKEVRFKLTSLRRPVAVALVKRALRDGKRPPLLQANSQPWFLEQLKALPADVEVDRGELALQDFGHCVAVGGWPQASALLLSTPDSKEERAAIGSLIPLLGPCLPQQTTLKLTAANVRVALAEPMYHLLSAGDVAQTPPPAKP